MSTPYLGSQERRKLSLEAARKAYTVRQRLQIGFAESVPVRPCEPNRRRRPFPEHPQHGRYVLPGWGPRPADRAGV
jgi:hypothetical protein